MTVVSDLRDQYGNNITATEVKKYARKIGLGYRAITNRLSAYKVKRGTWDLTVKEALEKTYSKPAAAPAVEQNLVPDVDANFIPFGNFNRLKKILKSGIFYPTFITGLSGNGKTFGVEQAAAQLKRDLIRVNITIETDEDDLIGGFRLVNGETVWHNGPVIEALQKGAVLLLDEVDLASNKILCLQSILEGKGVFLKKDR